jgi:signal transduction histidine kinase
VEEPSVADGFTNAHLTAAAGTEARCRSLLAVLREPILTTAADGRITGCNPAAVNLFGGTACLHGRSIQELLPFVVLSGGGEERSTWGGHLVDVTGRKLAVEVSRARLGDEQLPLVDLYVVHEVSRHIELNRLREQLLYSLAHELRGPLSVVDNSLSILAAERGNLSMTDLDQLLGTACRSVAVLRDLMDDLLCAGSIQSGHLRVAPRPIELSTILEDARLAVQPTLDARKQRVRAELPSGGQYVLADRRYGRQVFVQLLRNASKYSPEGEMIQVRAERAADHVRVTVEDRGPGISADQQAGLFERFYRVRPGYDEPGIGLGLAIARGIVEAHGGTIGVESQVGAGTSIWLTLPAAKGPVA